MEYAAAHGDVVLTLQTSMHKISGLTESDVVFTAKCDALYGNSWTDPSETRHAYPSLWTLKDRSFVGSPKALNQNGEGLTILATFIRLGVA